MSLKTPQAVTVTGQTGTAIDVSAAAPTESAPQAFYFKKKAALLSIKVDGKKISMSFSDAFLCYEPAWGDIEVYANKQCTIRPHGTADTLYVKFGKSFGFNDSHFWGSYQDVPNMMFIFTPNDDEPDETYQIRAFRNFLSSESKDPFEEGQIVRIHNDLEPVDVTNFKFSFRV